MIGPTKEVLEEISRMRSPPCVSLYQPTHRHHPDNQQDPIRFGNLLKHVEQSLARGYDNAVIRPLLRPLRTLERDQNFWKYTLDGLAVMAAPGWFRVLQLPRPVPERVIVADTFHTKPLWRFLQTVDDFQVLSLTRDRVRLFQGNRDMFAPVELGPAVPATLTDALGHEITEPHHTVASYGGAVRPMHHGHGGRRDQIEIDEERFFRRVDRAIHEHHSQRSRLPLVLAALGQHQAMFRRVSQNPFLVEEGLAVDPEALALEDLKQRTWELFAPKYRARVRDLIERFEEARVHNLGSDDLADVAAGAVNRRVATLLIEADRTVPGRIGTTSGDLEPSHLENPHIDDVLDDLGEIVGKAGGEVVVLSGPDMPTKTGVAAIFRYALESGQVDRAD